MARLIQETINRSLKIGSLSPKALSLYCLLIPKYNAYGKMNGEPYFIKGEVCPKVKWLTVEVIKSCLQEIHEKTNVKWWKDENDNFYLQSLNFEKYQPGLRKDRRGLDNIPNYHTQSGSTPGVVREYSKGEGEGEGEVEGEGELEKRLAHATKKPSHASKTTDQEFLEGLKVNPAYKHIDFESELGKMDAWLQTPRGKRRQKTRGFIVNWFNRIDKPIREQPPPRPIPPAIMREPPPSEEERQKSMIAARAAVKELASKFKMPEAPKE